MSSLTGVGDVTARISASEIVGAEIAPPLLAGLRRQYSALEFELVLSNSVDNLLRRDADIAVRMVEPVQKALVVKKLGVVSLLCLQGQRKRRGHKQQSVRQGPA